MGDPDREPRPRVSRRAVLTAPAAMLGEHHGDGPPASKHVDLRYRNGRLYWPSGDTRAAVGKGGIRADKKEGDEATPAGAFPLLSAMYRPDRIKPPPTDLPLTQIKKSDGWVDDPKDPKYNQLVQLPYPARAETLWRNDGIYDLLVVVGYNMKPVVPGLGSAIFLHIARPNFAPTVGCVAIARGVLLRLVGRLGPGSTITIEA